MPDDREELMRRLGASLSTLIRSVDNATDTAAKQQNLHRTDFICIGLLYRSGHPISPKQIIETLNLKSGSGTALLDRLERQGYIRRVPNPDDRRSVLVALDEERAAEPLERYRQIEQSYRRVTADLTDAELLTIAKFLDGVVELAAL